MKNEYDITFKVIRAQNIFILPYKIVFTAILVGGVFIRSITFTLNRVIFKMCIFYFFKGHHKGS